MSCGLAVSMVDLQTVLGLEDVYDLLEVAAVNSHNRSVMSRQEED